MNADADELPDLELCKAAVDELRALLGHPDAEMRLQAAIAILDRVLGPVEQMTFDEEE